MSKNVLKALMQLFAIIASPESNASERSSVVRTFLSRQLNKELVIEYLKVFNYYYDIYQKKQIERKKLKKRMAASSVRVLKICTDINEELTQKQKIIVIILLLEFIKSDGEITEQEKDFVETVSETFHIPRKEYERIHYFVLNNFDKVQDSNKVLVIDNNKNFSHKKAKHIYIEIPSGQIRVLQIPLSNLYIFKFFGAIELFLNGQLLEEAKIYALNTGASLKSNFIRPIYYSDVISTFNLNNTDLNTTFEAKDLFFHFNNGQAGLQNIQFQEKSGRLVGIMGASGTGKTTLLSVLNGMLKPSSGEVLINGINIHEEIDKIEGLIGYVSQDDLLIEDLTVYQNLFYNAKLCFDDLNDFQIRRRVVRMLQNLGLFEIRDMKVGSILNKKISGGQRKRLNIALELIREPTILFLDEPTSGLSSRDSEVILDLLKELSLKGKLIFVVIHQPSSDIFKMFDRLLLLDKGGYLIYSGNPLDAITYFKSQKHQADWNESECPKCGNVNPEQLFNIVETNVINEYGSITSTRKTSPEEWYKLFKSYSQRFSKQDNDKKELPPISFKPPNRFKQFKVFVRRDILSKLSNLQYVFINLIETPLLAFLLSYIIKYFPTEGGITQKYTLFANSNLPIYIFMSVIVAIFIGLTVSAQEIIKDRKILKREVFLNLSRNSYLLSKVAILFTLSAIQALIFVLIGNNIMEISGMDFTYWLVLFSTWSCSNLLGLNISDGFKTSVTIYILIPFLIIPQIILSGVLVKYDKLNPEISSPVSVPFYGEVILARWSFEAVAVHQYKNNPFEKQFYKLDKIRSIAHYKRYTWLQELENKLTFCKRHYTNKNKRSNVERNLTLLRNEIEREKLLTRNFKYDYLNKLYIKDLDKVVFLATERYFKKLSDFYVYKFKEADMKKNQIIAYNEKVKGKEKFLQIKEKYRNKDLTSMVRNLDEYEKLIEFENRLYQKNDPIYHDPDNYLIKSHFYAPRKKLFGRYYETFWVNIIVIWVMTIVFYITLYFSVLKKGLSFLSKMGSRIMRYFD